MSKQHRIWDIIFLFLAIILTAGLVILYVSREHFFYYYDYAGFEAVTADLAHLFQQDFDRAFQLVKDSIDLDYNYIFALPVIPFIQYLDEKRLVYELGISLVYQVPYLLAVGAIASRLFPKSSRSAFWVTVFLILLIPTALAPMLRGYPDVGGASLIALMIFVFLLDDSLKHEWQVIAIGLLAALAIIFRRHFAYPVVAFYMTAFIYSVIAAFTWENPVLEAPFHGRWGSFLYRCLRLLTAGLISILVMGFLARPLLERMLAVNFNALYASYQAPIRNLLNYYSGLYGWLLLLLAGIGLLFALKNRMVKVSALVFICLFTLISFSAWILVAGQIGFHYTLHLSILVVLGLTALLLEIWQIKQSNLRWMALVSLFLLLCINFISSLFTGSFLPARASAALQKITSVSFPPLVNPDYKRVEELVAFLRNSGPPGTTVYVVDSSRNMNSDMLRFAEQRIYGRGDTYLDVLAVPIVDSRDSYPLEELARADFVVVSTPAQVHLPLNNQKIVTSTHDAFFQNWEIAQDFRKMDIQLVFSDGSELSVYQRFRPTGWQAFVRAFHAFHQKIGLRPGSQPDWIYLGTQYTGVERASGGKNIVGLKPGSAQEPMEGAFLWAEPLAGGGAVTGKVVFGVAPCGELSAKIITSDAAGSVKETRSQVLTPEENLFSLPYTGTGAENLLFFLDRLDPSTENASCHVLLRWFPPGQ